MRKSGRRNIGSAVWVSMTAKTMKQGDAGTQLKRTTGMVHPIVWPPWGSIP